MTWEEISGALSGTGLTLTSDGLISGTPTVSGDRILNVWVADLTGAQDDQALSLHLIGGCCQGKVGDANMSGEDDPTIGDISVMIDMLFVSGTPVACLTEADINQSGGGEPTADDITIGDISTLIDHLFISGVELPDCL